MSNNKKCKEQLETVSICTILTTFDSWINFINGFSQGIQSCKDIKIEAVNTCITELLEGMISNKEQIKNLLIYCDNILAENEQLKKENIEMKNELQAMTEDMKLLDNNWKGK